jgi:hypothetical protein
MSGPSIEFGELHTRVSAVVAFAELELWADSGQAVIECAACGSGELMRARDGFKGKPFTLTDLIVRLEAHLPQCHATKVAHHE